jgi:hypothetical protein
MVTLVDLDYSKKDLGLLVMVTLVDLDFSK